MPIADTLTREERSLSIPNTAEEEYLMKAATYIAFDTLVEVLVPNHLYTQREQPKLDRLPQKSALFVTWTKSGQLRGCIGTFTALEITDGIAQYAKIAALHDTRFKPINKSELPHLSVDVTLLGKMVRCKDSLDWKLGKHGVMAKFSDNTSATFLPDVPEEQEWSKEETLIYLAEKAGTADPSSIVLYRYAGTKARMSYNEYKSYRC